MTGADMTGADMTGADLTGADLTGLFCRGHFDGGCFVGAVLSGPICRGRFVGADLSWAVLTGHPPRHPLIVASRCYIGTGQGVRSIFVRRQCYHSYVFPPRSMCFGLIYVSMFFGSKSMFFFHGSFYVLKKVLFQQFLKHYLNLFKAFS